MNCIIFIRSFMMKSLLFFLLLLTFIQGCADGIWHVEPIEEQKEYYTIYEDSFIDNKAGWEMDIEQVLQRVEDDRLYVKHNIKDSGWLDMAFVDIDQAEDFQIESTITKISGENMHGYGILYGYKDNNNYYEFLISADGNYYYNRHVGGRHFLVREKSKEIKLGNATNTLSIKKEEGREFFFINGKRVMSKEFQVPPGDAIGLVITGKIEVAFDNLVAKQSFQLASREMPLPSPNTEIAPSSTSRGVWETVAKISEPFKRWLTSTNNIAVVIGINNYQNNSVSLKDLDYAVSDAQAVRDFLQQYTNYKICDGCELYDENATKTNILKTVDYLINQRQGIDRIIFYFAGHGLTRESSMGENLGFFLPVDYRPDSPHATAITMNEVHSWAKDLRARHVLFIFDACFSGIIGGTPRSNRDYNLDFLAANPGRHVITAGTKDDYAQEYDSLQHGVLTHYLLRGLRSDADIYPRDGIVTLKELELYLMERVTNYTEGKQHPKLVQFLNEGDGELFIELK